jgi:2-oxoglutarate dehydrogenase E1 component
MDKYSYVGNADVNAIEQMYQEYIKSPESLDISWQKFFEGFEMARTNFEDSASESLNTPKEFKVLNLIHAYRTRGHLFTKTNPVRERRSYTPNLSIENFGLEKTDLETVFQAGVEIGLGATTLANIVKHLEETYCQSIGVEYMYIRKPEEQEWLRNKLESTRNRTDFSANQKNHILKKLNQAVGFEQFLHRKFVGQKRFSVEGGESVIPALDAAVERGSELGISEFMLGMAHRGRLNILANIFNKPYHKIFSEFEGKEYEDELFDGDVKYHLGYTCEQVADSGVKVNMTLAPNPSHLETVAPVIEGMVRARIDQHLHDEKKIIPILIHGDAAVAGQGIVYEVLQMAQLKGYKCGGSLHLVINNQVGFTTNYIDARSSTYCTDVAKTTLCPVFHVNADDVEAVVHTVRLAMEYRQTFGKDVFIDLLCYRKYGHNEGDEPKFTQPILYKAIAKHPNPRDIYKNKLVAEGLITDDAAKQMFADFNTLLDNELEEAKKIETSNITNFLEKTWEGMRRAVPSDFDVSPDTGYPKDKLKDIAIKISTLPGGKNFFNKIVRILEDRLKMVNETDQLDWAMGELLAYGSLLQEGVPVRLTGQDVERGTFSHRHALVKVEDSEEEYFTLQPLFTDKVKAHIYNSLLSEYGVMGFEYGYAFAAPHSLVLWEAQFGDFNNGAQIIIDQYLVAAEEKWNTQNGLVLLLPHGYEGQGAEHSSARLERFLQMCAKRNIQVVNCTTPANFFHVLRRQMKRDFRKPLIVMSPKSLLRHPKCVSSLDEMANGRFKELIDDTLNASNVEQVVFCSGKIYYDLLAKREEINDETTAIVRLEQLYPVPDQQIYDVLQKYNKATRHVWAQEEPENMGAWGFMLRKFQGAQLEVVAPRSSGAPASGSPKTHAKRHQSVLDRVFHKSLVK